MVSNQNNTEIILYTTPDGNIRIDTVFKNETIWLTQKKIAELFNVNVPAISKHLSNIYDDGELKREATVSKMETVQKEGNRQIKREREFYNMGLFSWKGSVVRKQDVSIAKNYLNQEEIQDLNEIVTMYLDYAERQA